MTRFFGLESVLLAAPDGATAIVTRHGAQVVSWIPAGDDERLFLSTESALDEHSPIRGGVPVVFPQFANYGPLPNHGLVRTREWRVVALDTDERGARATFRVEDCADTQALWPHAFVCELSVAVSGARLDMQLRIENPGVEPFAFCAGLHTYLGMVDIDAVRVEGLRATRYRDRTRQDREVVDGEQALTIAGEVDRIYLDAPHELVVNESDRSMRVRAHSFPDVVIWNPWKDKCASLDDLPNDAYRNMLCVEAAVVGMPLTLASRDSWAGGQTLIASRRSDADRVA
jgi:glucose-6-phosphate 1-epimerase